MIAGSILLCATAVTGSAIVFLRSGRFVSVAAPMLLVATLFMTFVVIRFAMEKRRAYLRQKQLENARQVTIEAMASVAETRDPETGAHIKRTQNYVRAIAKELSSSGHYTEILTPDFIELLFISAPLHDIGKVGVPDHILLKPGRLTPDEMEQMKLHAEFGRKIIFSTAARIDGDNFLDDRRRDRRDAPREVGRQRLPERAGRAGRAVVWPHHGGRRHLRRADQPPLLQGAVPALIGDRDDARKAAARPLTRSVLDAFFRIEDTIKDIAERFKDETEAGDDLSALAARLDHRLTDGRAGAPQVTRITVDMARERAL